MIRVTKRKDESAEDLLKRFKKRCSKEGIANEVRSRMYYDKPSVKRRKKHSAAMRQKK